MDGVKGIIIYHRIYIHTLMHDTCIYMYVCTNNKVCVCAQTTKFTSYLNCQSVWLYVSVLSV